MLAARRVCISRLRRQADGALDARLPVLWLAVMLYGLDTLPLKGVSANTGRVATLMAASADFRSGRRSRPGRAVSATLLGLSERTIERQWRILERLGVAVVIVEGSHLSTERALEIGAQDGEEARWRDRREWTLVLPSWARDVPVAVRAEYEDRARALLAELAYAEQAAPAAARITAASDSPDAAADPGSPVDKSTSGGPMATRRVAPSPNGFSSCSYLSGDQWFPQGKNRRCRGQGGAASRHSLTTRVRTGRSGQSASRLPVEAVELARDVLKRGRMPWLHRSPFPMLVQALRRYATAGWTVRDINAEAEARMQAANVSPPPGGPERPVAYLGWLLRNAELATPPAQLRDADTIAAAAGRIARQIDGRAQAERAVASARPALADADYRAGREAARRDAQARAARRRAGERVRDDAERAAAAAAARGARPSSVAPERPDALCAGGCGTLSGAVVVRVEMPLPAPLCGPCWSQVRHALR